MPWTSPRTWVAGNILTAAQLNVDVRDNTNYLKTEVDSHHILAGTSTVYAKSGGVLYKSVTSAANVGTGETTLYTQSIAANTLSADKQAVVIEIEGVNANGNTVTLKVKWGSTIVTALGAEAANDKWHARFRISRTGAATQKIAGSLVKSSGNASLANTTAAETLSGAVTLAVTGQGATSGDITLTAVTVTWEPAGN